MNSLLWLDTHSVIAKQLIPGVWSYYAIHLQTVDLLEAPHSLIC
jgi:hypothetical protein